MTDIAITNTGLGEEADPDQARGEDHDLGIGLSEAREDGRRQGKGGEIATTAHQRAPEGTATDVPAAPDPRGDAMADIETDTRQSPNVTGTHGGSRTWRSTLYHRIH